MDVRQKRKTERGSRGEGGGGRRKLEKKRIGKYSRRKKIIDR